MHLVERSRLILLGDHDKHLCATSPRGTPHWGVGDSESSIAHRAVSDHMSKPAPWELEAFGKSDTRSLRSRNWRCSSKTRSTRRCSSQSHRAASWQRTGNKRRYSRPKAGKRTWPSTNCAVVTCDRDPLPRASIQHIQELMRSPEACSVSSIRGAVRERVHPLSDSHYFRFVVEARHEIWTLRLAHPENPEFGVISLV